MRSSIVERGDRSELYSCFILFSAQTCSPPRFYVPPAARSALRPRTSIGHLGAPFNPGGKGPPVVHGQVGISFGITEAAKGERART